MTDSQHHPDMTLIAPQLRKPEGALGYEVAKKMIEFNAEANACIFRILDLQPDDSVLEIGFGPGEALAEAAQFTRKGYVAGIDHSPDMVTMASERNKRAIIEDRIELTLGSADALPYRDEMFDKVYCVNVAHFWATPLIELREILRVLKPGGRFVFFLPYPSNWLKGIRETGVFHARTIEEYERFVIDAGFSTVTHVIPAMTGEPGFCVIGTK